MNEKKFMTLKNAKILWVSGIIIEIGLIVFYMFIPAIFRGIYTKFALTRSAYLTVLIIYSVLILIALKIISDISQDKKIFYYFLAALLIEFTWGLVRIPITRSISRMHPNTHHEIISLLVKNFVFENIPNWIVALVVAILYFLVLYRVYAFTKDARFKLGGILLLTAVCINIIYGPINFVLAVQNYTSTKPFNNAHNAHLLNKISSYIWATSSIITIIALVILVFAILQMKYTSRIKQENTVQIQSE